MSHGGKPRMRSILSCGISTLSEGYNTPMRPPLTQAIGLRRRALLQFQHLQIRDEGPAVELIVTAELIVTVIVIQNQHLLPGRSLHGANCNCLLQACLVMATA